MWSKKGGHIMDFFCIFKNQLLAIFVEPISNC